MKRVTLRIALTVCVMTATAVFHSSPSHGQNIIGELIGPAVGPILQAGGREVLNRAGGEALGRGLNQNLRRGGGPGPVFRPMPSPVIRSTPSPVIRSSASPRLRPRPQPNPVSGSPYPSSSGSTVIIEERSVARPAPESRPSVSPPKNDARPATPLEPNPSVLDLALTHVVTDGPAFAAAMIRTEARSIVGALDDAIIEGIRRAGVESTDDLSELAEGYRAASQRNRLGGWHAEWLEANGDALLKLASGETLARGVAAAAVTSQLVGLSSDASFDLRRAAIEETRAALVDVPTGEVFAGSMMAVTAERLRILSNMTVITEIARVMGAERRRDLFARLQQASGRSGGWPELLTALTGVMFDGLSPPIPDLQLSPGSPSIALFNPVQTETPVYFVIDDETEFESQPGDIITADRSIVLAFDDGNGDVKRYTLSKGFFQWYRQPSGWEVRRKKGVAFEIDATASRLPFHYQLNGEPHTLAPGMIVKHESKLPPRIDFDRGLGKDDVATKVMVPGRFVVGVAAESGGLDLFPVDEGQTKREGSTTSQLAQSKWRESLAQVLNPVVTTESGYGSNDAIGALLDAIE